MFGGACIRGAYIRDIMVCKVRASYKILEKNPFNKIYVKFKRI